MKPADATIVGWCTGGVAALSALASALGLWLPGLYSEAALAPAMRGQDVVTLLVSALLVLAAQRIKNGSARAVPAWIGLMGYELYTYAGAAFAYAFNALFLIYIATFSLSLAALAWTAKVIDVGQLERSFDARAPRLPAVMFLSFVAVVLLSSELLQIVWAWLEHGRPALLEKSDGAGNFVYVLDLGVVTPLSVMAAIRFAARRRAGALLCVVLMVKSATMGLALISMTWFQRASGQPVEWGLSAAYAAIAIFGSVVLLQLLQAWHNPVPRPSSRLAAWVCGDAFVDTVTVRSSALPAQMLRAFEQVTLSEMPLARWLGNLRYLPSRFGSDRAKRQASVPPDQPFLRSLTALGSIVLERTPDEILIGTAGKLHQIGDQEIVTLHTPGMFLSFGMPNHERLGISVRAFTEQGQTTLVLEHRTQATDEAARRRFARYWLFIRPAGAFVSRQLLRAVVRRAERRRLAQHRELRGLVAS